MLWIIIDLIFEFAGGNLLNFEFFTILDEVGKWWSCILLSGDVGVIMGSLNGEFIYLY